MSPMLVLAVWTVVFGIWPLAEPKHFDGSVLAAIDVTVHIAGILYLVERVKNAGLTSSR